VSKRGWFWLVILGIGGIAGITAVSGGRSAGPIAEHPNFVPADVVAARFPQAGVASPEFAVAATIVGARKLALFDPAPMSPQAAPQPAPVTEPLSIAVAEPSPAAEAPMPVARPVPAKKPAAAVHRTDNRPGFVLNEAQIASIKRRLKLRPDQEQMWPSVEAALRSIAYAKAQRDGARHAGRTQTARAAEIDPHSPEVQGLKSAAFPLIMSFNEEQKSEVRALAHVMGLEKLASQF
jgi:hypothetical protein